ncbi:hypothetical protein SADUNF_Sadunf07G0101500 [Salix dunnii]|uniref:Uncharacterized protein n=1 Tax=Salix dunnii TaxID=1413687 RepID=A0A835JWF6_9ROSI|nr:hypothetical protein SADUNF_Sadunf07G0101500 [Salix dunnii]
MKFLARLRSFSFSNKEIAAAAPETEDVDAVEEAVAAAAAAAASVINGDVTLLAPGSGRRSKSRGRVTWRPALSAISEDRKISSRRRKPAEATEKISVKALASKVMKKQEARNLTAQMSFSGISPTPFIF